MEVSSISSAKQRWTSDAASAAYLFAKSKNGTRCLTYLIAFRAMVEFQCPPLTVASLRTRLPSLSPQNVLRGWAAQEGS